MTGSLGDGLVGGVLGDCFGADGALVVVGALAGVFAFVGAVAGLAAAEVGDTFLAGAFLLLFVAVALFCFTGVAFLVSVAPGGLAFFGEGILLESGTGCGSAFLGDSFCLVGLAGFFGLGFASNALESRLLRSIGGTTGALGPFSALTSSNRSAS